MHRRIEEFLVYVAEVRRYSVHTCAQYRHVLETYFKYAVNGELTSVMIRNYEVWLMDDMGNSPRTVNLHLSVLSSFCRFLMKKGDLVSNPVHSVTRPKQEKRLPEFYREESMREYFNRTMGEMEYGDYERKLAFIIMLMLSDTGLRRGELISLDRRCYDVSRKVLRFSGKGDKMREVPVTKGVAEALDLYLASVDEKFGRQEQSSPLLVTPRGGRLYPVFVDRTVKKELASVSNITVRRSPHVLRHTLATELLVNGADLNSIKELLGHSSLAATQVYTHNSIERIKAVYKDAHPRASDIENLDD